MSELITIYDAEDRLIQVRRVSDNSVVADYTYNFNGLRKSKTVNGQTTNFSWDDDGNLIRESDSNDNTLVSYYYDANGNLVGLKKNGQTYIYHTNLRGDIVSITDYNGNIVAQYNYDPWGNQISYSGTLTQPFEYAGYYADSETDLYYLKSRYYSPALGRFLTTDSYDYVDYDDPQTLNLYSYCGNNPVSFTDPDGNFAFVIPIVVGGVEWAVGLIVAGTAAAVAGAEVGNNIKNKKEAKKIKEKKKSKDKSKDDRLYGEPGSVNETDNGYKKQTRIGSDGRAESEVHHTDHGNPKVHSNPHKHKIEWKNGNPKFGPPLDVSGGVGGGGW